MARYYLQAPAGVLGILVRHGSTVGNDPDNPTVRAWEDLELTGKGQLEAQFAAMRIDKYDPKQIFHSDLMRDSQTGQIIANLLNIPAEADFNARTWDVGTLQGKPESEANPVIHGLYKRPWETPQGSSESFNDFSERWINFLESKLELAANVASSRPVVIVTHGRNLALSHSYIDGITPWEGFMPYPGGTAVISVNADKSLSIEIQEPKEPVTRDV